MEPVDRKVPMSPLMAMLIIGGGILFLMTGLFYLNSDSSPLRNLVMILGGGGFIIGGLWNFFSPTSTRNQFYKSPQRTTASIEKKYIGESTDSWGGKRTIYHIVFKYSVRGPSGGLEEIVLAAKVKEEIYESLENRTTISIQHAEADPRIVLVEGEF